MQSVPNPYLDTFHHLKTSLLPLNHKHIETLAIHLGLMHNALGVALKELLMIVTQQTQDILHNDPKPHSPNPIHNPLNTSKHQMERISEVLSSYTEQNRFISEAVQMLPPKHQIQIEESLHQNLGGIHFTRKTLEVREDSQQEEVEFLQEFGYRKDKIDKWEKGVTKERPRGASIQCAVCHRISELGADSICMRCKKKEPVVFDLR